MQSTEFDNEMQQLSLGVYKQNKNYIPNDWIQLSEFQNSASGFYGQAFYKNDKIILSFRGTDFEEEADLSNDKSMFESKIPSQYVDAQNFYEQIKKKFPTQEIIFTGHSLGGSLAQLMSNKTDCKAVTFNAFGTANLLDGSIINDVDKNITNYGNQDDIIFNLNLENQLGKTYMIGTDKSGDYVSKFNSDEKNKKLGIRNHFIENIGNLENAVEYKPKNLEGNVEINVDKKDIDLNRIFTREEIGEMSESEYSKKENIINQQLKNFGTIPTKAEAEERVKTGDLIWVDSYTRDDGTSVSGYYRRR